MPHPPNRSRLLPPPEGQGLPAPALERIPVPPPFAYTEADMDEASLPLSHYLWIVRRHAWKIAAFVAATVAATVVVSSRLTPVYESTATVDIDRQMPSGILGQEAAVRSTNDADQFIATQIRLIQSDSVLRPVVQRLKIPPSEMELPAGPVPAARAEDAPVVLKRLKVTRPANTYLVHINYRSSDPYLAAAVANGVAQSYIEHTYNIRYRASVGLSSFMEKQLEELRAKMERSSSALVAFERELNVINPEEKTSILSARLLQLNTEFTNAQADRVRREAAFRSVTGGSLEAAQASTQGEQLRRLAERVDEARERFASLRAQYGANHPEYKKGSSQLSELERQLELLKRNIAQRIEVEYQESRQREAMLKTALEETKAEFDRLNARSFEYKALKQEADTDKKLYEELVRKIKEAGINASFQNSSIRLADAARPALRPVFPNLKLNVLLALLLSAVLAMGVAVVSDMLDHTVRDPEQIQRVFQTHVIGSLPTVRSWNTRRLPAAGGGAAARTLIQVGQSERTARFEEAIRTLRDSILLADVDHRPRTLLFTSANPREGKSTTTAHLAIAHALQERRTLLIDCDLRRPSIHGRFGLTAEEGLSTLIQQGGGDWRPMVRSVPEYPDLDILPAGPASRRAADRLGEVLERILDQAAREYDLIVIDAPPLLGFAEPLQIAALVDGVVVVTLAGQTHCNAVASVMSSLKRLKANVIGIALNEVHSQVSSRYYYYGSYSEKYHRYYSPKQG